MPELAPRATALAHRSAGAVLLDAFLASLDKPGVPGTGIYPTTQHDLVPSALALNLKHRCLARAARIAEGHHRARAAALLSV
jgi:K+ transporter